MHFCAKLQARPRTSLQARKKPVSRYPVSRGFGAWSLVPEPFYRRPGAGRSAWPSVCLSLFRVESSLWTPAKPSMAARLKQANSAANLI